jgi:hypothetical protein
MTEKISQQSHPPDEAGTFPIGFWWIAVGIILLLCGIAIEISVLPGLLDGSIIASVQPPPVHYRLLSHIERVVILFSGPLLPGLFSLCYGLGMRRKAGLLTIPGILPGTTSSVDKKELPLIIETRPESPTGVPFEKGPFYRDPFEATIRSVFVPGLGQAYNGRADLGLLLAFVAGGGLLMGLVPGILVWIYAVWEANSTANKINREEVPVYPSQVSEVFFIIAIFVPCLILTLFLFSLYGPAVALGLDFSTIRGH